MAMWMRMLARTSRFAGVALVFGAFVVVTTPSAASAHGVGGIEATNYRTRVDSVDPVIPGVAVRAVDLGTRLELTNYRAEDVLVLGYDGEPYLRVGPRGAFENIRSPATYLNRTARPGEATEAIPATADSNATPRWRGIDDSQTVRWHDHRVHWMGRTDPPSVQRDPGREHLVQRFQVELRRGDTIIAVRGDVRWIPGPSPAPWVFGAVVLAALVIVASRFRHRTVFVAAALGMVATTEALHVVGSWGATTVGTGGRLGASIYAIGAVLIAVVALVWVLRRGLDRGAPLVLLAGLFLALAGGLTDVPALGRSGIPTTLPLDLARATVMTALGAGLGLAAVGGRRLRVPERTRNDAPPSGARV